MLKDHLSLFEEVFAIVFGLLPKAWQGCGTVTQSLGFEGEIATSVLIFTS
jgi:hypothetical protein